jgi:hypothetical protein
MLRTLQITMALLLISVTNITLLGIFANPIGIIGDKIVDIITLLRIYGNLVGLLEITKLMDTMCNGHLCTHP